MRTLAAAYFDGWRSENEFHFSNFFLFDKLPRPLLRNLIVVASEVGVERFFGTVRQHMLFMSHVGLRV